MKSLCLIFCFMLSFNLNAQKIKTAEVLKISDSLLKSRVGDEIFKMFKVSEGSYYTYSSRNGSEESGKFLSKDRLRKDLKSIYMLYHFDYPAIEGVSGGTWVKLNNKLELVDSIDLSYIPEFVKKKAPSTFISKDEASKLAMDSFEEKGLKVKEQELRFEKKYGKYIYQVNNILTRSISEGGQETGQMEIAEIDAETGEVLSVHKGVYGLKIR